VRLWRIASAAQAAFDGEAARRHGSRWTPKGSSAVFASATLSLAVLERFVHTDPDLERIDLVAISADIGPDIAIEAVAISDLPGDWRAYPAPPVLALVGQRWLEQRKTIVLSVPSAIIPDERNFLLNPAHADFATLTINSAEPFSFDPRMWKSRR
jgi:RES domain-containing protein